MPRSTTEHTPTHLVGVGKLDDEGHQGLNLLGLGLRLLGAGKSGLLGQSTDHARLGLPAEAAHQHTAAATDGSTTQTTAEYGGSARGHAATSAEEGRAASAELLLRLATAQTAEVEVEPAPSQEG